MREDYCLEDAAGLPEGTDFCVIAESDCMEPYIKRGGRVCVSRKQTPAEGEAGLFLYRGAVYCRQWCEDYTGALYLLAQTRGGRARTSASTEKSAGSAAASAGC